MIFEISSHIVRFLGNTNDEVAIQAAEGLTMSSSTFRVGEKDVCGYFQRLSEATYGKKSPEAAQFANLGWSPATTPRRSDSFKVGDVKGRSYAVVSSR